MKWGNYNLNSLNIQHKQFFFLFNRDNDKKLVCDQAFRDKFLEESLAFSIPTFEKLIQLSFDGAIAQTCSPTLPVLLLTDAFEILPLATCEQIFYMVEMKVAVWKQELFFNQCKNSLLRLCNGRHHINM